MKRITPKVIRQWHLRHAQDDLHKYFNTNIDFICPICLATFSRKIISRSDKQDKPVLTLDHYPPQCLGGRQVCLTCQNCNNTLGKYECFLSSALNSHDLTTTKLNRLHHRVAIVKSCYLKVFTRFGYRCILDPCFNDVRKQILNPDQRILPDYFINYQDVTLSEVNFDSQDDILFDDYNSLMLVTLKLIAKRLGKVKYCGCYFQYNHNIFCPFFKRTQLTHHNIVENGVFTS